ncbi:MAG TPA: 6-phosphogluconolactonase [Alphaproteobacteria bacterium]|nr:6-phosphogluconolactonase [Alphaproteobacteria bacterium]
MTPARRNFADKDELAAVLAAAVADHLRSGIAARGTGVIAVSGGTTPARFFARLGRHRDVDWAKVFVTLVDERWVPETSPRSNAALVNEKLLQGPAAVARFVPLYAGGEAPDAAALARTAEALAALPMPFDAVILGMGSDGHTASFFPGADNLEAALGSEGPVVSIHAPGAGEPRVTLTLPRLLRTAGLYLHIEGDEKAAVLDRALGEGPVDEMPVRAVLRQDSVPVTVFWSP